MHHAFSLEWKEFADGLPALLRTDRVDARDELEAPRNLADGRTDHGFERIDLDPNHLLFAF